jgi:arylsulfatase A-like enzyme
MLLCVVVAGHSVGADDERPNFLVIVTDDQSPFTLAAYGNAVCRTPNIDRLAATGMTFDAAYHMGSWVGAVCVPSRTMLMTGRTLWHIPNYNNEPPPGGDLTHVPADLADNSLAAIFNRAGYDTFRTCKEGNSYLPGDSLFTVLHEQSMRGGTPGTSSEWHGDQAVEFLQQRAASGDQDPFLMFLGFSHPHDTRDGTPDLLERYGAYNATEPPTEVNPLAPPLPMNYLPAHPFPHGHPMLRDEEEVSGVLTSRSEATVRNEIGREYACIELIDMQIGRVLAQLEEMGELDNTYIVFTSDHGIAVGRHGLMGKQNLYEHTWRVPMIVVGRGIEPGSRARGNIYLLDLLPTLCDLARIQIPETVEGASFALVLGGLGDRVRDVLYGCYCGGTLPGMRSVRIGDWKLIKYDVMEGTVRETQLFNLAENPHEFLIEHHAPEVVTMTGLQPEPHQINLADDPRYAEKRRELEAILHAEMLRLHDPHRLWDQPQE